MTQECQIATWCREAQWRKSIIGAWVHAARGNGTIMAPRVHDGPSGQEYPVVVKEDYL